MTDRAIGAAVPLLMVVLVSDAWRTPAIAAASLLSLAALGAVAARTGGAAIWKGAGRVGLWGVLAMAITAGIGALFGTLV